MTSFMPGWRMPQNKVDAHEKPFATFCITIPGIDGKPVGVMGVDVQTSLLSQIVLSAKPSPHFYSTLLSKDGSFIVHPDSSKQYHQTAFTQIGQDTDPAMKLAAEAMVKGDTGYRKFQMDGTDYYVFYKPFKRSAVPGRAQGETGWSVGIVYPEDDIFGDYNRLLYYVLIIAVAGLVLLFVLSRSIIHGQLLPLRVLTRSAQHIARGNYNELIPDSQQNDEIGQLQDIFQQMQQSLSVKTHEQERLMTTLLEREDSLRVALNRAKKADGMKMAFLHNMTNQMIIPATAINEDVNALCHFDQCKNEEEANRKVDDIQRQGQTIANLLNELLHISEDETGKEARP
jgi:methyl-accepting chemotaxis protein/sigma-B regulation protein RsbU (phosphoserine phosphatase)